LAAPGPSMYSSEDEEFSYGSESMSMSSGGDPTSPQAQHGQVVPQRSVLDMLLLAEWEDRAEQGLFRWVGGGLGGP
jgi:hypothetical protein